MTALESWCLAMIGLVFEALLAYVVVLLELFKRKTYQVCYKYFYVKLPLVLPYSSTLQSRCSLCPKAVK